MVIAEELRWEELRFRMVSIGYDGSGWVSIWCEITRSSNLMHNVDPFEVGCKL